MLCRRCPHLIRHGYLAEDGKNFEFRHICGLLARARRLDETAKEGGAPVPQKKMVKKVVEKPKRATNTSEEAVACESYPFPKVFDYIECPTYQQHFKTTARKNDVVPTKDFQYSDVLNSGSITDMELL